MLDTLDSADDPEIGEREVLACVIVGAGPAGLTADQILAAGLLLGCAVCDGYEFTGKCIGVVSNSTRRAKEAAFIRHFSQNVWFIEIAGRQNEPRFDAAIMARLQRLPGLAQHVAVSQDHKVFVTMDDGSGHRCEVLYAAIGVDPRTQLAAPLGAPRRARPSGGLALPNDCGPPLRRQRRVNALDQISVAMGHAAVAATTVHNTLLTDSA